ncbi:hypothetical protein LEP1GSC047_2421 [Leptospira inadai serovar Lyme str. 10]|uniref:Uncharacterized protein n=1 Tax=Leptospira inadai serovar Lyme str. 10 TaxID=1049790 RepID=V6I0E2_9LEPT|nr:hypothetical protein LEP1GSC047_2421 [Leptospira inadai serovar Lyme str. 10]
MPRSASVSGESSCQIGGVRAGAFFGAGVNEEILGAVSTPKEARKGESSVPKTKRKKTRSALGNKRKVLPMCEFSDRSAEM